MGKKVEYFESNLGNGRAFARATSRSNFVAKTGAHPDYVSFCTDRRRIALCDVAGEDRYVLASRGTHEFRPSKLALERDALAAIKAEMGGNSPVIEVRKAEDGSRHVMIDGEMRGRWYRLGTIWRLADATGHDLESRTNWSLGDEGLHSYVYESLHRITMYVWSEAAAIANAMQAWRDGSLPPLAEQREKEARRQASRDASKASARFAALASANAPDLLALLRNVAEGKPSADEAQRLLAALTPTDE